VKDSRRDGGYEDCPCGRKLRDAAVHSYQSSSDRYLFFRCLCGNEWTERLPNVDRSSPISSDEVIEVHAVLSRPDLSLPSLLQQFRM
jgi:hypothetical protein